MKRKLIFLLLALLLVPSLSACVNSVISESVLMEVDRAITLPMVQSDPDGYIEQRVLWGGELISIKNFPEHTRIEILAQELVYMDEPSFYGRSSQGRFIIEAPGFYDKLVYKPGLGITVAGVVKGVMTLKIGELSYPYVLISPIEMKTFDPNDSYDPYSDFDYPYFRNYPYFGPYGPYPAYPSPHSYDSFDPFLDPYYGPYYPGLPPFFYPGGYGYRPQRGHHH
jgi:outer membrane lipoprotein